MPDATPKPARWYLPSRRWLRFSLRTFLIFVLAFSLLLGWLGMKIDRARRERQLVAEIREAGGLVGRDAPARSAPPDILLEWIGTAVREHLPSGHHTFVDIGNRQASNAGHLLPEICLRMPDVTCFVANDTEAVDADLRFLGKLDQLEYLSLAGNEIGDASAGQFAALTRLTDLDLRSTNLSDDGLHRLSGLPNLQFLDISGTPVSAEGLRQFRAIRPEVRLFWEPRL